MKKFTVIKQGEPDIVKKVKLDVNLFEEFSYKPVIEIKKDNTKDDEYNTKDDEDNTKDEDNIKKINLDGEPFEKTIEENVLETLHTETLSKEQQIAFEKFKNGENLFITGPGGTGKTKLVKHLVDYNYSINKKTQVCALTGCAAVLIGCNARTIHSFSGIKLCKGKREQIIASVTKNRNAVRNWRDIKCLILDEVSMLSKKVFEIIEEISRKARKNNSFFGGIQVVFLGDFFQLGSIEDENDPDTGHFCFESTLWNQIFTLENHIQLTKIFRQNDPLYIEILMQIRKGELDEEKIRILESYVKREYDPEKNNGCIPTKLFALRSKTDFINSQMFSKIKEKEYVLDVIVKTDCKIMFHDEKPIKPEILLKCSQITQQEKEYEIENLLNTSTCLKIFRFKKGASVMCTVNLDMDNQICNGAQGIIIDILEVGEHPSIVVKFSNGIVKSIGPYFWQSEEYPTIAVGNYPLMLAWALTIHKIQGATLKLAEIDIGSSIFEYGQTYVALSRIQSLEGLYLSAFQPQRIRANPVVVEFYNRIGGV
jgi:ATP-dependent DNA helicase PIF1